MTRIWIALALFAALVAGPYAPAVRATVAVVQCKVFHGSGVGTSMTLAMNSTITTGAEMVVFASMSGGSPITSVTDDAASCGGYTDTGVATSSIFLWKCNGTTVNAGTITVNTTGTIVQGNIAACEITGQAASNEIDTSNTATPGSSSTPQGAAVTTSTANTAIVSVTRAVNTAASLTGIHSGNAFTQGSIDNGGAVADGIAYLVASSTGTYQSQWDLDIADSTQSITVAIKQLGGGGAVYPGGIPNSPIRGCCGLGWLFDVFNTLTR